MADPTLAYFAKAGPTTELSKYADLLRELPDSPE
jgi:hypothetical protein